MFDKMKQLMEMQKKAREVQKVLEELKIEKTSLGGKLKMVMNGNTRVESLSIAEELLQPSQKASLEKALSALITEAGEEARQQSVAQAMSMMKGLALPGM